MRFAAYRDSEGLHALGRVEGSRVYRLRDVSRIDRTLPVADLLAAQVAADASENGTEFDQLELLPVCVPGKIFCVGLNYYAHVDETGRDLPTYPVLFPKFASNLIGHGAPIALPPESTQVDYEAELAVVIGQGGRRIPHERALEHVLGYTIANDITMRDFQYKTHQWMQGKAWDASTPLGPVLVTPDELDPSTAAIRLRRNGVELQSASIDRLIFDIAELIAVTSRFTALETGDVILTGTPGGVGYRRDPQIFLHHGDIVEVEIDGIGVLRNPVRAEDVTA